MQPNHTTKHCRACGETKPIEAFPLSFSHGKHRPRPNCRKCHNAQQRGPDSKWHPPAPEGQKWCGKCGQYKPLDDFAKSAKRIDGRQGQCRACQSDHHARRMASPEAKAHKKELMARVRSERREYYREQGRAYAAARRAEEPDRQREASKRWYERKGRAYAQQWKKLHREQCTEAANRYRARLLGAYREPIDRTAIFDRDNGTCYLCGKQPKGWHRTLDHVIPLSRGGSHTPGNLRVACRSCNASKNARMLDEL